MSDHKPELFDALRMVTYHATRNDWLEIAKSLEDAGERRLARAIKDGVSRRNPEYWGPEDLINLRFTGGSIAKLDRYLA